MAYDETLAQRIRPLLAARKDMVEKKMFGGMAFLLDGKMCCGVLNSDLVARLSADDCTAALKTPHVRPMDFTGKPMTGFLYVGPAAIRSDANLSACVERCATFVRALPAKPAKKKVTRPKTRK